MNGKLAAATALFLSIALPLFSSSFFAVTSTYYVRLFPKRYFGRLPWPILWIVGTCLDVCSCSILDDCFTDLLLILVHATTPLELSCKAQQPSGFLLCHCSTSLDFSLRLWSIVFGVSSLEIFFRTHVV